MTNRLILCLDGTWNTADGERVTNIVRVRDLIDPRVDTPDGPEEQRVYYHNGVGTGLSTKDKWIGGAAGLGLGHTVRGAYKFVSQHYRDGTEIYLFGFSRGAFTARSLAGYISASGLLKPEFCSPENEARAWRYYSTAPDDRFPSEREQLRKLSFDNVRIRLVGVFDTVGALGVPLDWFGSWNRRRFQFHDVALGSNVDYAFHALAIDEKRGPFQATLWQYPNHKYFKHVEQVWFPGVHANVGGGYENTGLSDRSLFWMLSRIEKHAVGLKFVDGWTRKVKPETYGELHDSRTAAYWWSRVRPMIRVINQRRLRLSEWARRSGLPPCAIPLGEMLDYSALSRWRKSEESPKDVASYRPENVEAALNDTFNIDAPQPIPIVGPSGEPLDWMKNEQDREALQGFLPRQFQKACEKTAKRFAACEHGTAAFSSSYQQPRLPIGGRRAKPKSSAGGLKSISPVKLKTAAAEKKAEAVVGPVMVGPGSCH